LEEANLQQRREKSQTIFIVYYDVSLTLTSPRQQFLSSQMIEGKASHRNYAIDSNQPAGDDRLPLGSALLAIFGLSLLGWAIVLAPVVAILYA